MSKSGEIPASISKAISEGESSSESESEDELDKRFVQSSSEEEQEEGEQKKKEIEVVQETSSSSDEDHLVINLEKQTPEPSIDGFQGQKNNKPNPLYRADDLLPQKSPKLQLATKNVNKKKKRSSSKSQETVPEPATKRIKAVKSSKTREESSSKTPEEVSTTVMLYIYTCAIFRQAY